MLKDCCLLCLCNFVCWWVVWILVEVVRKNLMGVVGNMVEFWFCFLVIKLLLLMILCCWWINLKWIVGCFVIVFMSWVILGLWIVSVIFFWFKSIWFFCRISDIFCVIFVSFDLFFLVIFCCDFKRVIVWYIVFVLRNWKLSCDVSNLVIVFFLVLVGLLMVINII